MVAVMIWLRAASVLLWSAALGFGIPCVIGLYSLASGHGIATVMGFPAYGNGPFEQHSIHSSIPLLLAFLAVCCLEAAAGGLLWAGAPAGAVLALVLLLPGAAFWWGFALPFGPTFAIVRTVLIVIGWRAMR